MQYTKFRLSDHNLLIEQGRGKKPKIPRKLRICPICHVEVENEIHFLTKCNAYHDREVFFNWISTYKVPSFKNLTSKDKYIFLMSQEDDLITAELAKQIFIWFTRRADFISNTT